MTRLGLLLAGIAIAALTLAAQSPRFDVVSVKPSSLEGNGDGTTTVRPGAFTNGRYLAINSKVMRLIQVAFASEDFAAIEGAPSWMQRESFDVDARAGIQSVTPVQLEMMLRNLLAERFRMTTHVETRTMKVYDLVVRRADSRLGPNLRASSQNCSITPRPIACGIRYDSVNGATRLRLGALPMEVLADRLRETIKAPVTDRTGLTGLFDVELTMSTSDDSRDKAPDVFGAVQEQLGLRLVEGKGERRFLVIDHIERPTPN